MKSIKNTIQQAEIESTNQHRSYYTVTGQMTVLGAQPRGKSSGDISEAAHKLRQRAEHQQETVGRVRRSRRRSSYDTNADAEMYSLISLVLLASCENNEFNTPSNCTHTHTHTQPQQ